jgi:hypothetical protein
MHDFILICIESTWKSRLWFLLIQFDLLNWKILHTYKKMYIHWYSDGDKTLLKESTPWSVCAIASPPTFFCSWNVHFWWHGGRNRWSHFLDWSRSGRGSWSGRLRGQSMTCHGDWFRCHHWRNNPQIAEILHNTESSWDCSKSAANVFSSADYSELQICCFYLTGFKYTLKN